MFRIFDVLFTSNVLKNIETTSTQVRLNVIFQGI